MICLRRIVVVAFCWSTALFFTACLEGFGLRDSDVTVSLAMSRAWESPPILHVYIEGRPPVSLAGRRDGQRVEREIEPRLGSRLVAVLVVNAEGDTLASTRYSQSFERGKSHWVATIVGEARPIGHCIGVLLAIPLRSAPDTAFVMYGSLPQGAVC